MLWRIRRTRPEGLKFRRQHPCGPFVFDFDCRSAALAVEVDGLAHNLGDNPLRDQQRDEWARNEGIETLRIPASDVRGDPRAVLTLIVETCRRRTPPPPAAVPLPAQSRGGEIQ